VPAAKLTPGAPIPSIHDGLFFTLPDALPLGRHDLAREQVLSAQRERLMAAMTELMAAWPAYPGVVHAARQLAADALDTEPEPDLGALASDLEAWLVDLFRLRRAGGGTPGGLEAR
jgi:hypothetical protein